MLIINPTLNFQAGSVSKLPVITGTEHLTATEISIQAESISKQDWDNFETSWDFESHPLVRGGFARVSEAFEDWEQKSDEAFFELKRLEEENNRYWIDAYGLQGELSAEVPEEQITIRRAELARDVKSLVSYAVSCMMGRFSLSKGGLCFAGGEFDLSGFEGTFLPDDDGIIPVTDAAYFDDDVSLRFERFLGVAFGLEFLSENLDFVADALGRKSSEGSRDAIRRYFVNEFINDHIRLYSKRPIYWLFSSGKQRGFNALVYMHRYSADTLATMQTSYVLELQTKLLGEVERLEVEYEVAESASAKRAAQRRLKELNAQLLELRDYLDKVQHAADKRISIDLDDGVAYNYSLFEGLVYEGSDLKMVDLKSKSAWKRELLAG